MAPEQRLRYILIAAAVLAAVILIRFAWVMSYIALVGWRQGRLGWHRRGGMVVPTIKGGLVVSWCGMRGIVTLVAALALPNGQEGAAFPFRDLIVFVAFCVVLGTLLIQGLTLRWLLLRLNLRDDDPVGREVRRARRVAYQAALASLYGEGSRLAEALRVELQVALAQSHARAEEAAGVPAESLRMRAVGAARRAILAMRKSGEIGDVAFHRLEEEMDRIEMSAT